MLTNNGPLGGAAAFPPGDNLGTRLQAAGLATGMIGKFLNNYDKVAPDIPAGWTWWSGHVGAPGWSTALMVEGSTGAQPGVGERIEHPGYITDVETDLATEFIDAHADQPFFLLVSFLAPHYPHIPDTQDAGSHSDYVYRDRSWDEADVSDKPSFVAELPRLSDLDLTDLAALDLDHQERLETLASVDRGVRAITRRLEELGLADDTLVVFTSDNGQLWGEHRITSKGLAYAESVRVPLLIWTGSSTASTHEELVAMDIDLAATALDLAGAAPVGEGRSLLPALCGEEIDAPSTVLIQGWPATTPHWAGLVSHDLLYVEYATGERELYDLVADPFEEHSLHDDPAWVDELAKLSAQLSAERAMGLAPVETQTLQVGQDWSLSLQTWGGQAPLSWSLVEGELPEGIELVDGELRGRPVRPGTSSVVLQVSDSSVSPLHGGPLVLRQSITLTVQRPTISTPEGGCGTVNGGARVVSCLVGLGALIRRRRRPVK